MPKVYITGKIQDNGIELLKRKGLKVDLNLTGKDLTQEELKDIFSNYDALVTMPANKVDGELLFTASKNLKVIANYAVGYDNIDLKAAGERGIMITNTPGPEITESVAEHAFALMLSLGRSIVSADKYTRSGKYKYWDPLIFLGPQFNGKTLGIVGFGRIGRHLAKIARNGLNMTILYSDVNRHETEEKETNAKHVSLEELLQNSDVISLNCNYCAETKHLINERTLHLMKPTAYLINTSRGGVIDEKSLAQALKDGVIEGAALDVFEEEPKIHPDLLKMENVILTPHIASATREARIQMARMAAENVVEVLINNRPPINLVNKELSKDTISSLI